MLNALQSAKLDIKFQKTMQNGLPPATLAEEFNKSTPEIWSTRTRQTASPGDGFVVKKHIEAYL